MFSDYLAETNYKNQEVLIVTTQNKKLAESHLEKPVQLLIDQSSHITDKDSHSTSERVNESRLKSDLDEETLTKISLTKKNIPVADVKKLNNFINLICISEGNEEVINKSFGIIELSDKTKCFFFVHNFKACNKIFTLAFNMEYFTNEKDAGFLTTLEVTDLSDMMIDYPCKVFKSLFFSGKKNKMLQIQENKSTDEEQKNSF